jgi:hypothetical protein
MGHEPEAVIRDYMAANGVSVDDVISVSERIEELPVTPILVVLGRDARVRAAWLGSVSDADKNELLRRLQDPG